jgi:hypothetical protein
MMDCHENEDYFTYKNALLEWGSRDYWKRLWVVQEFLLARDVRIMCGDYELQLNDLDSVRDDYCNIVDKETRDLVSMKFHKRCFDDGDAVKNNGYHLNKLLEICYTRECTDPRDRIFGLQGLLRREDRLEVDYALSPNELYHQVSKILDTMGVFHDVARLKRCAAIALEIRSKEIFELNKLPYRAVV